MQISVRGFESVDVLKYVSIMCLIFLQMRVAAWYVVCKYIVGFVMRSGSDRCQCLLSESFCFCFVLGALLFVSIPCVVWVYKLFVLMDVKVSLVH
jgi:hypothetical protein